MRRYAIEHGLYLDDEYEDPATSARKLRLEERPQMSRLMEDIRAGEIDTLLVYKRDRLARTAEDYMTLYELFREKQVTVTLTADNEFPMVYSPIGEFFELFMAGVIEHEGDQIAERIQAARIAKFYEGNFATKAPYGYARDKTNSGKPFTRVEPELKAVRRIFDLVLSGTCEKISDVTKILTAEGFTRVVSKKQDDGTRKNILEPFGYYHVTKIVQSAIYMGEQAVSFAPTSKTYEGLGVVSYDEWQAAQDQLAMMITRRERTEGSKETYVLTGFIYCGVCRAGLEGMIRQEKGEKIRVYECPTHKNIRVHADVAEEIIAGRIKDMLDGLMSVHFHKMMQRYVSSNEEKLTKLIEDAEGRIHETNKKIAKRVRRLLHNKDTRKREKAEDEIVTLHEQLQQEEQERFRLESKRARLSSTVPRIKEMRAHIDKMDANLPEFFDELIYRIELGSDGLDIKLRHPFLEVGEVLLEA